MPDPSLLRFDAVDFDGRLHRPRGGARVGAAVEPMVGPSGRIEPHGLGLPGRDFASRRR